MLEFGKGILVFSMIHAYVFAIVLFTFRKKSSLFVGLYLLASSISYFLYLNTTYFHIESLYFLFYYLTPTLSLASIPLIYFYVKYMTSEQYEITFKRILLHFSPSILFLITTFFLLFSLTYDDRQSVFNGETEIDQALILFLNYLIASIVVLIQAFIYSYLMLKSLYKHDSNVEEFYSNKSDKTLVWLKVFVIFYIGYYLFEFAVFLFKGISISETIYFSVVSLHIFFVGYMGIKQREIYKSSPGDVSIDLPFQTGNDISENSTEITKKTSIVTPELRAEILTKIDELMKDKKIYLQEDLSLYDLAQALDIHKNYLSHIINDSLETNFYNLINSYRIDEAKKMLLDPEFDHLSIEGIAQSVGFKSRSVFYPVFKKFVGVTPTEFKKNNQK